MVNQENTGLAPTISVIIPTYNYADYICSAINSVLTQHNDCEIIVIDDGSTDNTRELVSAYNEKVKYVHQDNAGVSAARNHGISLAKGEYLIFLDADDTLLPDALSILRNNIKFYPDTDCFLSGYQSIDKTGRTKYTPSKPLTESNFDNFRLFLRKKLGGIKIAAANKRVFENVKFPETIRNNEDIVLLAQILANSKCRTIDKPIIKMFKHDDSLRHNLETAIDSTHKVANELFNPALIPKDIMGLKDEYSSRVILSRFRALYLAGQTQQARKLYHEAIALFPKHLLLFSYLKKYLKSWFK